VKWWRNTLF